MPSCQVPTENGHPIEIRSSDRQIPAEGGPHHIGWTHPEIVNPAPPEFSGALVAT
jgi:hypothetical protein